LLFMGEEYGENAPFQFFTDHIDQMIADATRDGRREEFASFTAFEAEEIPDPQDPETFERSKLTRERDDELAALYARLLDVRRRLPPAEPELIEFDEQERWLRVRRGRFDLLANFSSERRRVPCSGTEVVLATCGEPAVVDEAIELEPMSGVLVA
jgi:maltooligosyltrehalose trehalohydrolase